MTNMTTKDFCHEFRACADGTRFARKFKTMRECYAALLNGEAAENSAEWAIWTITRPGVMSDRDLRLFAVKCARRVQHLMKDERSVKALDVAERHAKGEATDEVLAVALDAAYAAVRAATRDAALDAAYAAAWAAACDATRDAALDAASDAAYAAAWAAALDAERREQLAILATFGNPFGEAQDA